MELAHTKQRPAGMWRNFVTWQYALAPMEHQTLRADAGSRVVYFALSWPHPLMDGQGPASFRDRSSHVLRSGPPLAALLSLPPRLLD